MNKLFINNKQQITNIFKLPAKICTTNTKYCNNKHNKNTNNNKKNDNKQSYIPKITINHLKYNKKKPKKKVVPKTNLLKEKEKIKDIIKKIHKKHEKDEQHKHKETIPKRIRELVWTTNNNETFSHKCYVSWCDNNINVFNFQVGHDIPESKGGTLDIDNLKPICSNCNLSMSNKYTITEWSKLIDINNINDINSKKNKKSNNINSDSNSDSDSNNSDSDNSNNNSNSDSNNSDSNSNSDSKSFISKIINKLPNKISISILPTISVVGFVLTTFRYLKV